MKPSADSRSSDSHSSTAPNHWKLLRLAPLFLLLLSSCAVNPVTGKKQLSFMSSSQEETLGAQSDKGIVAEYGLVDDSELAAYVNKLGQSIVKVSHIPEEDFEFRVLDDDVVNAFALPGGYVYITRGILAYLNDEAALVGVMGHEVGHVAARHSAQRYTKQVLVGVGLGLGSALSETLAKYSQTTGAAAQLLLLKYSRDDENQADELGVEYGTKLGYNTVEMAKFFHTLDLLTGDGAGLPGWASTHPDPGDRTEHVTKLTRQWQAKSSGPFHTDHEGFVRRLEGLVFGPDPRQGYVREKLFIHPGLGLHFPVPKGWKLMNSASQVQMGSSDGKAAIFFSVEAPPIGDVQATANDPGAAGASRVDPEANARVFSQRAGLEVLTRQQTTIDGHPALVQKGRISNEKSTMMIESTFISWQNQICVFHALSEAQNFNDFHRIFTNVAMGFAKERDPERLAVRPVTLHLIKTSRRAPFSEQVAAWPPPSETVEPTSLALLNGMGPNDLVPTGTSLKVLRR